MNVVVLQGVLSRPPELRELPSGARLVAYEVTTRQPGAPAQSVPVVWFDPPSRLADLRAGTEVVVTGTVRRRFFQAGGARASRTEVVAAAVLPRGWHKRVAGALDAAVAAISEPADPG